MRDAHREFKCRRIKRCVDLSTGEIISQIPRFLMEKYVQSPMGLAEYIHNSFEDEILALINVGKTDGRFSKKEKVVLVDYIHELLGETKLPEDDDSGTFLASLSGSVKNLFKELAYFF